MENETVVEICEKYKVFKNVNRAILTGKSISIGGGP